jgi:redox-sensitive bicupin YhaK (pirin superfamily)
VQATPVQATVRSFDAATRSGSVFLADGTVLAFGGEAFDPSGLRLLRPGQRVTLRCGADGGITALTLATFPLPEPRPDP